MKAQKHHNPHTRKKRTMKDNETLSEKLKRLEHEELMENPNYRAWYERQQELIKQAVDKYEETKKRTAQIIAESGFVKSE